MENFISAQDKQCRLAFDKILEASPQDLKIRDQYDRYKIWAANTGTGHTGQAYKKSLDYRLREAHHYRDQIVNVLKQLHQFLVEAELYVTGKVDDDLSSSSDEGSEEGDLAMQETVKWTLSDSEEDDIGSQQDDDPRGSVLVQPTATGLEWLSSASRLKATLASIEMTVTYLYRIPVRESATYNRLKRNEKSNQSEFDLYVHFDRLFVRDVFPNASESLVFRLGKLVTNRRRILHYRQLYNEELQREVVNSEDASRLQRPIHTVPVSSSNPTKPEFDNFTDIQPSTLPKSSLKASTFRPKEDLPPDTGHLLSSGVSEADEVSSIAPTVEEDNLVIPARPQDSQGQELLDFVCPYCGVFKHIRSDRAWKRHILQDLEPYVCTYEKCTEPDRMFNTREDWFIHESQHYSTFFCGTSSHQHYDNIVSFREHMSTIHSTSVGYDGDMSKMEIFLRRVRRLDGHCNLCGQLTNHLKHHTGRHLERIALFALPRSHIAEDAVAEQPGDSDISVGIFQGSKRNSSNPDSRLRVSSDTSSINIHNLESSSLHLNRDNTTPSLHNLMRDWPGLPVSESTFPKGFLPRLENRLRRVLVGKEHLPTYDHHQFNRICIEFLRVIEDESGRLKRQLEIDQRAENIIFTFFSIATRVVRMDELPAVQATMRTVNRHVSHFVLILSRILDDIAERPALNSRLVKLAKDLVEYEENSDRPRSTSPSPNDVPDTAQEEHWNAIKPELGLPAITVPPIGRKLSDTSSDSFPSDARYRSDFSKSQDNTLYVLVLGSTRSGKTSFIDNCLGSARSGPTTSIVEYNMEFNGRAVCFIDTPGHGDLTTDIDTFLSLSQWLYDFGPSSVHLAVLIFHRTGQSPHYNTIRSNLRLYKLLCGKECYPHIALITTGWDGENPAKHLAEEEYLKKQRALWADIIQGGAITAHLLDDSESALDLLSIINGSSTHTPKGGLQLQREIHWSNISLSETSAGSEVLSSIREAYKNIEAALAGYDRVKAKEDESSTEQESYALERNERTAVLAERLQKLKLNEHALLSYDVRRQAGHKGTLSSQILPSGVEAAGMSQQTRPELLDAIEQDTLMILPDGLEPNSLTVGLTQYVTRLASDLPPGTNAVWDYKSMVIWGPPGIGKTHLAKEYMWQKKAEYPGGIFWIDCTSYKTAMDCIDNIAGVAGVAGANNIDKVRRWIQGRRKWLMIFDHLNSIIDHRNSSFQPLIPLFGEGHVVCTSCDRYLNSKFRPGSYQPWDPKFLKLHCISMEDSLKLIFTRFAITIPNVEEEKAAMQIFEETNGFPVLLHCVISLLQEQRMPLGTPVFGAWIENQFTSLFQSIARGLADGLSFLRIFSFWSQRIPVAMILLGERQFHDFGVGDIVVSIRSLVRKGWLEDVVDPDPALKGPGRFQFRYTQIFSRAFHSDSSIIQFDRGVQRVVCNATKRLDRVGRPPPISISGLSDASWIDMSTLILCTSFKEAQVDPVGSGVELGAYEVHARALRAHYPAEANPRMKEAFRLDECLRSIQLERERKDWGISHWKKQRFEDETAPLPPFTEDNLISLPLFTTSDTRNRPGWKVGSLDKPTPNASGPIHLRRYSDDPILQQTVETGRDMEATPSSSTKRSTALKAIFQGTNLGTAGQSARLPTTVAHSGSLRLSPSLSTARSSSPVSFIHSSLTALNRSVSETIAQGEVSWSKSTPAPSSTEIAYSALLHNLAAERKREGKQPARRRSFSGSGYSGG